MNQNGSRLSGCQRTGVDIFRDLDKIILFISCLYIFSLHIFNCKSRIIFDTIDLIWSIKQKMHMFFCMLLKAILRKSDCCKLLNFKMSTSAYTMSQAEILTRALWRAADAVCFDVDSTVCMDEAIDELAKFAGKEKEVTELTLKAMRGGLTFREALQKRLELIHPSTTMINNYLMSHPAYLTPGIEELICELHDRGIPVYLVSGGFREIIEPIAEQLDIPRKNVFANTLKFFFNGEYAGFDENEPTSHQEGKAEVVAYLKHRYGYRRLIMIGDGATDLAASPPADAFIGFGGNQVREKVKQEAKWFVMDFQELLSELRRN